MRILFASSSFVSFPILDALLATPPSGVEVIGILSNIDKSTGRGKKVVSNAVVERYNGRTPIFQPANSAELAQIVSELAPDLVITCAFGQLIKEDALAIPTFGWINIHFSLLPRWRGAAPVQWGLLSGDQSFGFSIFALEKGMDTGPLYLRQEVTIGSDLTRDEVLTAIATASVQPLLSLLPTISNCTPTKQDSEGITLAPKITKEMGRINWKNSTKDIFNQWRALTPDPGVFTYLRAQKLELTHIEVMDHEKFAQSFSVEIPQLQPGEWFIPNKKSTGVVVGCLDGLLFITRVKPANKSEMGFSDFARGTHLEIATIGEFDA
jgi:methionyl-tRNA formyltransferase